MYSITKKSRNIQLGLSVSGTHTKSGKIGHATKGSNGTSSNGRSSIKSLHNASPLTYLMKDTKVVDSAKIREPVLQQKYQKYNRLGGGYTKKTVNQGKIASTRHHNKQSKSLSN